MDKGLSEGWDKFPPAFGYSKVVKQSRVPITILKIQNDRQIIAQDAEGRKWLLTLAKPLNRVLASPVGLESTELEDGLLYYMIVPPVGYKWWLLLHRIDRWFER
jgi:hypothetical protein